MGIKGFSETWLKYLVFNEKSDKQIKHLIIKQLKS